MRCSEFRSRGHKAADAPRKNPRTHESSHASLHFSRRSFSLVEMILVLALLVFFAVLGFEGYLTMAQSGAVTTGAALISDALTEGRSRAVAQNTTVEVRLYRVPAVAGSNSAYSALQLHWIKADGTTPPVAAVAQLPAWVSIDATPLRSSLLATNPLAATPDPSDTRLNVDTRIFHFLPDGSTDLNPATNWFLTVRPTNQADPAHFPSDWACVQVDATTGRVQIYRP